jgi:hypothetical protein
MIGLFMSQDFFFMSILSSNFSATNDRDRHNNQNDAESREEKVPSERERKGGSIL